METAYKSILVVHVLCGVVSLVTGLIAIFAKKGGRLHNRVGVIYYWGMFGVFVTTIGLFGLKPTETRLQFFLCVAVASFYQTFTGRRTLGRKKPGSGPARLDWVALGLVVVFGVATLGYGVWMAAHRNVFMAVLFGFFTFTCLGSGWADYKLFSGKKPAEKGGWLLLHIGRMMGSYAATVTAFLVNMSGRLPASTPQWVYLTVWILPGVLIAGFGANRFAKRYRQKLGGRKTLAVVQA